VSFAHTLKKGQIKRTHFVRVSNY